MAIGAAMDPAAGPARRAAAMRLFIDYWNGDGAWARTSPRLRDFFLRCHDRIRAEFRAVACEAGGLGDLGRIACPTLAVMGLESPTPSLRVTELVARAVPGAVLRIVPDAGHMLPLTDPHVVDPMIGRHLAAAQPAVRAFPSVAA